MQIEYYEYFMAIASGLSFQEAAARFGISPSSMSKIIYKLESELGIDLFDRENSRSVTLSHGGQELYTELLTLYPSYRLLRQRMDRYRRSWNLFYTYITPLPDITFDKLVNQFVRQYPNISTRCKGIRVFSNAVQQMQHGVYDCVIAHRIPSALENCTVHTLYEDRLMVAMSSRHPLASQSSISLDDIRKENMLLSGIYYDAFIEYAKYYGSFPNISLTELGSLKVIQKLINLECITLFYDREVPPPGIPEIVTKPIKEILSTPVVLISPEQREMTSSLKMFSDFLTENYEKMGWRKQYSL